jgi:hypothetical protein
MSKLLLLASFASVAFACSSDYAIWIPRSQSAEPLYRFFKGGKAGYIDATGRVVIPPTLKTLDGNGRAEFHGGLVEIGVFDGIYADRTGKVVLDKGLYRGWDFSEGLAVAMRKGENVWGYIDTAGEFVISPQFATSPNGYVHPFSDGFALIEVKGLFGYIDKSGKFAIPPQFLDGASFADGMARIVTEGLVHITRKADVDLRIPSSRALRNQRRTILSVRHAASTHRASSASQTAWGADCPNASIMRVTFQRDSRP